MDRCSQRLAILGAAAFAVMLLGFSVPTRAQQETNSPTTPAPPAATSRLAVHLRLGDGTRMWRPSRRQIGASYAPGGSDQSGPGQFHFIVNRTKLRHYLAQIAPYIHRAAVDAHPVVAKPDGSDDGTREAPATISPGHDGKALDIKAATDLVAQTLEGNPGVVHIVLPVKIKPAQIREADLQGIDARIGYFVTRFNPGDVGRTMTVRHAIEIINGHVLTPNAIFSVNQVVGERTPAHGFYGKGHVFINGKMEVQAGGGMCQVATTLFNAAMLADLKIVERHQHVRTIPYAAPGRDATVYWGQKDFKFQNNTDAPVYISYVTTRSHAIASLYGKGTPGMKVKLVNHYRRLGERHYTGVFYRVVYLPDGTVHKDTPFYSAYKWTPALDFSR